MIKIPYAAVAILLVLSSACGDHLAQSTVPDPYEKQAFRQYWESGETEINWYSTTVENAGDTSSQTAILCYKLESFSRSKLTELKNPDEAGDDLIKVLSMNRMETENATPVSLMTSVYTPLDRAKFPNSVKLTMSSQAITGHSFVQLKLFNENYRVSSHSYLPAEDMDEKNLRQVFLEDEVYTLIRLNPTLLPTEKFQLMPSMFFIRTNRREIDPLVAVGTRTERDSLEEYSLQYTQPNRKVTFLYDRSVPHTIRQITEESEIGGTFRKTTRTLRSTSKSNDLSKN